MIVDRLSSAHKYAQMHPTFEAAFAFLQSQNLQALTPGRHEIDADKTFAMVQEYNTRRPEEAKWESHRRYIDIQFIVSGRELIQYAHIEEMKLGDFILERDFQAMSGDGQELEIAGGYFAIFFPHDAHMPGLAKSSPGFVKKVVIKCLL